jgi:cellulose synthase (UDP-forming)
MVTAERAPSRSGAGRHRRYGLVPPQPPSDEEKTRYADRNLALINRALLGSLGALLISQFRFVFLNPVCTLIFLPFLVFSLGYYALSLCVNLGTRDFDQARHRALVDGWQPARYPSLDVFLPICGEPASVLVNTWTHVARLVAAYPGPVTAYVLDDSPDESMRPMAASFGFTWVRRPNRGWMKKAGNLRHGFEHTAGDFILILDADFAPRTDLPGELLPYFDADQTIGIVQSPQYFRTTARMSWTERGAGAIQEMFYRLVQVSRDRHEGAICVGSCAIYRRTALASIGGSTLIGHSEDVHTGFDLRRAGWGLRYVPVPLAAGLCPSDPDSFLAQQYRWCAGSMALAGARKFWTLKMSWRSRSCYVSGYCYYIYTALFTFAAPAIPLVLLTLLPDRVRLLNYLFILPSIIYGMVVLPAWHRCRYGPEAYMAKLLYGWAHVMALWDIGRRRQMGWQSTGAAKRKAGTRRIWVGLAVWNGGTSVAWVALASWRLATLGSAFVPLLALGLFTSGITAMALAARRNHLRVVGGTAA